MNDENIGLSFLDHSDIIGYICDTETYDLMYMTKAAMRLYGMTDERVYHGQKCHKVLHGLDEPCPLAPGISRYAQEDTSFPDVFHRVDGAMYRKKAAVKETAKG